jgi:type IV pilus assembly protein PilQ
MKNKSVAAVAALLAVLAGLALPTAVSSETETPATQLDRRISLDLRNIDIVDVLKYLAKKGGLNLFISSKVEGRAALYLQNVRIDDALNLVIDSHGLALRRHGPVLYVMTIDEYAARYGEEYALSRRQTRTFRLHHVEPAQALRMLEPLKSSRGTLVIDPKAGNVMVIDVREKLDLMERVLGEIDRPATRKVYDLGYAKAADMKALVGQLAARELVNASFDARTNQLVVTAPPEEIERIDSLVAALDRRTRQVTIDTQIMRVLLEDDSDQGIDWRYLFNRGVLESLDFNVNFPRTLTSFGSVGFGKIPNDNFEFVLNFIRSLGDSKILASPRLTVVEGGEARILIGSREAYVTSTTTTTGAGVSNTAEAVSFIDVGISLKVSPTINREGYVTMKIKPEVSSVDRIIETPSDSQIPIVDTTQAETQVMVKDGTTIVIGGLRKDEKIRRSGRIPYLSDIPLLGNLFKQNTNEMEQSELVVFLTPHVITEKNQVGEPEPGLKGLRGYGRDPGGIPENPTVPSTAPPAPGGLTLKDLSAYAAKG